MLRVLMPSRDVARVADFVFEAGARSVGRLLPSFRNDPKLKLPKRLSPITSQLAFALSLSF